jgi:hypothetical protein
LLKNRARPNARWLGFLLACASLLAGERPLNGQALATVQDVRAEVFAGEELEQYLRVLQITGRVPLYPFSVRAFSPREVQRLAVGLEEHPWEGRYALGTDIAAGWYLSPVAPTVGMAYNSAFPWGLGDGPVWAGRGLTTSLRAGAAGGAGPLSFVLAPILFRAENRPFTLRRNGLSGRGRFADGYIPSQIDLPQRFGDEPYTRLDPGQSTVRLDARGVALGVSTANQVWGPAVLHPIILGHHAPGFPHAFLGSSRPVDLWVGHLHGRVLWGRLDASPYSLAHPDSLVRFSAGAVAVFTPRGAPGVELGLARFYHAPWRGSRIGFDDLLMPFEGILKQGTANPYDRLGESLPTNQLLSVFTRWVAPRGGFEVYGEYAREDHSWDVRDFLLQPDHTSGYMLGFRRVWQPSVRELVSLRGEVINTRSSHLRRVRWQGPFYQHQDRHGHTHRGQALGSPLGYEGGGSVAALDYHHPRGRWTASWIREVRDRSATLPEWGGGRGPDVTHALGAEALIFWNRIDVAVGLNGAYNWNRDFASNVFNVNATLGLRYGL